jgi:predicted glycosyltransferase
MAKYLIVDGMLHGTGIRDAVEGEYIYLEELGLDTILIKRIEDWLSQYEAEHYAGYIHEDIMRNLDKEGISIAVVIQEAFPDSKIEYYSDALMRKISITEQII